MEDVEQTINEKMDNLNDSIRNRLENLTGTYLSDVISKVYKQVNVEELKDLDNETVESIFSRIDEKILSEKEKEELRNMLEKVNNEGKIEEDQKVIAHFLLKLLKWHKEQQEQEQEIRNFVRVCNQYLVNKEVRYDNIKLRIDIISKRPKTNSDKNNQESHKEKIELKMLSSGEKQIISLLNDNLQLCKKQQKNYLKILEKHCDVDTPQKSWIQIKKTVEYLKQYHAKSYIRGKYELWFFVTFINKINIIKDANDRPLFKSKTQINEGNAVAIIAPRVPFLSSLKLFLEQNFNQL